MKRPLRLAALAGCSLLFFVLLLEGTLRALRPFSAAVRTWLAVPQDALDYDRARSTPELLEMSLLGFHPFVDESGFVTNSRGFRTPEYDQQKAPGTWRVVALGDSFTFASGGVPWPDLWTTRLAAGMAAATPRPVELVNLGVPAVGPSYELRVWRLEAAALQPDLVVLALFVGNDFTDERWIPEGGWFSEYGRVSCDARLLRNLVRGLEPVRSVTRTPDGPADLPPPGTHGGYAVPGYERVYARHAPLYTDDQIVRIETRNLSVCDPRESRQFEKLYRRVVAVLHQLHSEVDAAGSQLAVLIIPSRCQVCTADRTELLAAMGRPESDFDWDAPQRRLASFLQAEGIPFLDLTPALRESDGAQALYSHGDTHWSPAGNALVAERVAAWAATQGWPPQGP